MLTYYYWVGVFRAKQGGCMPNTRILSAYITNTCQCIIETTIIYLYCHHKTMQILTFRHICTVYIALCIFNIATCCHNNNCSISKSFQLLFHINLLSPCLVSAVQGETIGISVERTSVLPSVHSLEHYIETRCVRVLRPAF